VAVVDGRHTFSKKPPRLLANEERRQTIIAKENRSAENHHQDKPPTRKIKGMITARQYCVLRLDCSTQFLSLSIAFAFYQFSTKNPGDFGAGRKKSRVFNAWFSHSKN
jgi:hypothetical protein